MLESYKIIPINGFDSDGEPEIREFADGTVSIVFNFMPPLNGTDEGIENEIFENFDKELKRVLDVEVIWDDREVFFISEPQQDTVTKLKNYLESFWIHNSH